MEHWQDIVIAIGSFMFAVALIPSVLSKHKPSLWTSVATCFVLVVFVLTYSSLHLWYAALTTSITAIMWVVLAVQKASQAKS